MIFQTISFWKWKIWSLFPIVVFFFFDRLLKKLFSFLSSLNVISNFKEIEEPLNQAKTLGQLFVKQLSVVIKRFQDWITPLLLETLPPFLWPWLTTLQANAAAAIMSGINS